MQSVVLTRILAKKEEVLNDQDFWYAAGRTRTGTVSRLILSQVRLPIPPQRHMNRKLYYHNFRFLASVFLIICTVYLRPAKASHKSGNCRKSQNNLLVSLLFGSSQSCRPHAEESLLI